MAKKKKCQYVAITAFGSPGETVYVAPGGCVDDILDQEGIDYYLAKGCITLAGTTDDPNTWDENTPYPTAPTVGEMVAEIRTRMGFENTSHVLPTEFGKEDIPELNKQVIQPPEDPEEPEVDITKKESDGS